MAKLIPVYTSSGDLGAYLLYPYLFNREGEWIGFVTQDKSVYTVLGVYVGYLADGPRILRKRGYEYDRPRLKPPPAPKRLRVPPSAPLAPLMPELQFTEVDILQDEPDRLLPLDSTELLTDLD